MVENITSCRYALLKHGILYLRHWRMSDQMKCERLKHLCFDDFWIKLMKYKLVQTSPQNPISLKFKSMSSQIQFSTTIFYYWDIWEEAQEGDLEQKISGVAINNGLNPTISQKPRCWAVQILSNTTLMKFFVISFVKYHPTYKYTINFCEDYINEEYIHKNLHLKLLTSTYEK